MAEQPLELDLTTPRPTVASALLEWAGGKVGGRTGAILRRLAGLFQVSPIEAAVPGPAPLPVGAIYSRARGVVGPLYHGTAAKLLPRILREGLRPFTQTNVKLFAAGPEETFFPAVYLTRDPMAAAHYAQEAARVFGGREGAVLRVRDVPAARLLPDEDFAALVAKMRVLLKGKLEPQLLEQLERAAVADWRASFRLSPQLQAELGAPLAALPGTATVAHVGTIPPRKLEVLETARVLGVPAPAWPKTAREHARIIALLERLRRLPWKKTPWWLD